MPFSPRHVLIASILNPLLSYNLQQQNSYKTCLWLLSSPSFTHALLKPIQLGFSPSHLIEIAHGKDTIGLHSAKLSSCISIWNNCLFERIHHFLFTERRLVFFLFVCLLPWHHGLIFCLSYWPQQTCLLVSHYLLNL
jgi:hypothetical protein